MWKGKDIIDEEPKVKIMFFIVVPPLLPILFPVFFISDRISKRKAEEIPKETFIIKISKLKLI